MPGVLSGHITGNERSTPREGVAHCAQCGREPFAVCKCCPYSPSWSAVAICWINPPVFKFDDEERVCSYERNTCVFLCFVRQAFSLQVLYDTASALDRCMVSMAGQGLHRSGGSLLFRILLLHSA